ncbi:MAG: AsmA family protein [Rhizobiaceae bacterium]
MKRFRAILAAGLVLGVALLISAPYLTPPEKLRQGIETKLWELTGIKPSISGKVRILLFPFLTVEAANVFMPAQGAQKPFVEMERMRGNIGFLNALRGRFKPDSFELIRPTFNLRFRADGSMAWPVSGGRLHSLLEDARAARAGTETNAKTDLSGLNTLQVGHIKVVDGLINLANEAAGTSEMFSNLDMQIDWPTTASALVTSGNGVWRNEAIEFSVGTDAPLLLAAGGTSVSQMKINSATFRFTYSGDSNMLAGLHLSGNGALDVTSLNRFLAMMGQGVDPGINLGSFGARGKINVTPSQVQFTESEFKMGENTATGILQLVRPESGIPQVNGTLAFSSLNLDNYVAAFRQYGEQPGSSAGDESLLKLFDSDIRLSAGKVKILDTTADNMAAAISARNARLTVDVGNAEMYDGTLVARLIVTPEESGTRSNAEGTFSGVALGKLTGLLPTSAFSVSATSTIKFSVNSLVPNTSSSGKEISGLIDVKSGSGSLSGVDFSTIHALMVNDSGGKKEPALGGSFAFDAISGKVAFDGGRAWLRDVIFNGKDVSASLYGGADMRNGGIAVRARIAPTQGASERSSYALVFVGGTLAKPIITRDPALAPAQDPKAQ